MSMFDPDAFLSGTVDQEMDTSIPPIPEGNYKAIVEEVGARESGEYKLLDVTYELLEGEMGEGLDEIKEQLGRKKLTVRQSIFLDVDESGAIAIGDGKNIGLGRLREAAGQNRSGQPWSPLMLKGVGPLVIGVTQRPDKNDETKVYNDVRRVAAAA